MPKTNFITDCVRGITTPDKIDNYVAWWHNGISQQPIHEFLGMTEEEYEAYVKDDSKLIDIIERHKNLIDSGVTTTEETVAKIMKVEALSLAIKRNNPFIVRVENGRSPDRLGTIPADSLIAAYKIAQGDGVKSMYIIDTTSDTIWSPDGLWKGNANDFFEKWRKYNAEPDNMSPAPPLSTMVSMEKTGPDISRIIDSDLVIQKQKYLEFIKVPDAGGSKYEVRVEKSKYLIGHLLMEVSGDFLFWAEERGGYNWYCLAEISEKMKELNALAPHP